MTQPISKIEIPDWWAEVLDRVSSPRLSEGHLFVSNPLNSDYADMTRFWEELPGALGTCLNNWLDDNLNEEHNKQWDLTWSNTNFILAYLNPYSRPLFVVVETGVSLV